MPNSAQFNHAIVAIEVDPAIVLPSVVQVDKIGRLLLFDPTSKFTNGRRSSGESPGLARPGALARFRGLGDVPDIEPEIGFKIMRKADITLLPANAVSVSGKVEELGKAAPTSAPW